MKNEKWFRLLIEGSNREGVSIERLKAIKDKDGYEVLEYVLNTLDVLDKLGDFRFKPLVRDALKWCEVAKGGSPERRVDEWYKYNLSVHNIGSSQIYARYTEASFYSRLVGQLIRFHGTIGQYLRGEVSDDELKALSYFLRVDESAKPFKTRSDKQDYMNAMLAITRCVIAGISESLWADVKIDADLALALLGNNEMPNNSVETRLGRMFPGFAKDVSAWEYREKFKKYNFWYPEVALGMFDDEVKLKIIERAIDAAEQYEDGKCHDICFKQIANQIYYDFKDEGKKVNIYKKRMVESYINGNNIGGHLSLVCSWEGTMCHMEIVMSPEAGRLVDFFIEAETSSNVKYHQAISSMCELLGLKKDSFDRLGNEDSYLNTMDDISGSRKGEILNHVIGNTIVDVGSGSGVLLVELKKRFPEKRIIGTDISTEVIERLKDRERKEQHGCEVVKHNFVDGKLPMKADTIIFSSILHEIFSFSEPKFDIRNVRKAIRNAYDSLNPGGRIIIRDGVLKGSGRNISFTMGKKGLSFWNNFVNDFKGLVLYDRNKLTTTFQDDTFSVAGDEDYIREFLYTYTWGEESYPQEVQEQFGYFTVSQMESFLYGMGAEVEYCESYLEPGYTENLIGKEGIILLDWYGYKIPLPDSNMIVVARKPL